MKKQKKVITHQEVSDALRAGILCIEDILESQHNTKAFHLRASVVVGSHWLEFEKKNHVE